MTLFALTPAARRDLAGIWLYTADNWGPDQADRYVTRIEHDLAAAAGGSPLVRRLGQYWRIKSGHHFCVSRKSSAEQIIVVRILHERQDIVDILEQF